MTRTILFFSLCGLAAVAVGCADGDGRGPASPTNAIVEHQGVTQSSAGGTATESNGKSRGAERRSGADSSSRRSDTGSTRPTSGSGPRGGPPPKR